MTRAVAFTKAVLSTRNPVLPDNDKASITSVALRSGNLEQHHFKYAMFRRPGDVHCHFFGASAFSYVQGFRTQPGDRFEISSPTFGRSRENALEHDDDQEAAVRIFA